MEPNLLQKLLEIRKTTEYMQKTETGNQGAKYVDPAVLLKKIRDKMNVLGVLLFPSILNADVLQIDAPTKNNQNAKGFLFKADSSYTFIDADNPEDKLNVPWYMTGKHGQDPAMAEGGALTYSERYFLLKFFQIPTSKDDPEFFQHKTREPDPKKEITIGNENLQWIGKFCEKQNIKTKEEKKEFSDHYKFDVFSTTIEEFVVIKATIETDYNEA